MNDEAPAPEDALSQFLRVFLGIGLLMVGCSVVMLFFLPRDSAEFVVSICNIFIGLTLITGVALFIKIMKRE